jgi:hypothetical protein
MATDNVTPIGPHATMPAPPSDKPQLMAASDIVKRIEAARLRMFAAMAIISVAEHASPSDEMVGEPLIRYALREAYAILDGAAGELDSGNFEVAHG